MEIEVSSVDCSKGLHNPPNSLRRPSSQGRCLPCLGIAILQQEGTEITELAAKELNRRDAESTEKANKESRKGGSPDSFTEENEGSEGMHRTWLPECRNRLDRSHNDQNHASNMRENSC